MCTTTAPFVSAKYGVRRNKFREGLKRVISRKMKRRVWLLSKWVQHELSVVLRCLDLRRKRTISIETYSRTHPQVELNRPAILLLGREYSARIARGVDRRRPLFCVDKGLR